MSKCLISVLDEEIGKKKDNLNEENVRKAITDSFEKVEQEYIRLARKGYEMGFGKFGYAGACALVSIVVNNKLYVANLGDCKGLLLRLLIREGRERRF